MELPLDVLAAGLWGTLSLALFAWITGGPVAIVLAFFSNLSIGVKRSLHGAATTLTVIPFLVILVWIHYPLQSMLGVVWPPYWSTAWLLALFVCISAADILATQMQRLRATLEDAAKVSGITTYTFLRSVVFPAALESSIPRFLLLAITSIHITMFASLIGVEETFRVIQRLNARFLKPVELFTIMAAIYTLLCVPLYLLALIAGKRMKEAL